MWLYKNTANYLMSVSDLSMGREKVLIYLISKMYLIAFVICYACIWMSNINTL